MALDERTKSAHKWFKQRERELKDAADANGGRLPRHELWRYAYYRQPYLLLEADEVILERFADVMSIILDITSEGKIAPVPMMQGGDRFTQLFTEIIEETGWRGILTNDSMGVVHDQLNAYFADGVPFGVRMFRDITEAPRTWLFKFSKAEFVADMHKHGRFRVSPASFYAKGSHIRAVKDLETKRDYRLKAIDEALAGATSVELQGQTVAIVGGAVPLEFVVGDYYLFSTCNRISRRMPTDFEANAVHVIKERNEFLRRFRRALLEQRPTWEFLEGDVYYFDPYNDIPRHRNQEFFKHISFAYQWEHRCVLRPKEKHSGGSPLKPFFVELGSMADISEVINAP